MGEGGGGGETDGRREGERGGSIGLDQKEVINCYYIYIKERKKREKKD